MRRIGLFGGTFNPPHLGHLIVAASVSETLALDRVMFVPSFISPHKQGGEEGVAVHRVRMVQRAIEGDARFECSDIEISRQGTSYTIDTLIALRALHPADELFLLIGADNFPEFQHWKSPERILELATLVVMHRPGSVSLGNATILPPNAMYIDVPGIEISSSEIRERVRSGMSIKYLVPESVENYIRICGLYT
jgi:nicotinate-nucleotide adenylyltransferase